MALRCWRGVALTLSMGCSSFAGYAPADGEATAPARLDASASEWIRTAPVGSVAVPDRVDAPGWLVLLHDAEARLATPVPGRVAKVHVRDGARVQAGDPLVTLDSAEAARLRAEASAAEVDLRVAQAELERQERLAESGLGLAVERMRAEAAVQRARMERDAARQAAAILGEGHGSALVLRAPIEGVVVGIDLRPGQAVAPEDGPLLDVAHTDRPHARLDVYEDALKRVQVGQRVRVSGTGGDGEAVGRVVEVAGAADPATRRGPVLVELDEVPGGWVAGRMVRGRIDAAPAAPVAVPVSAVVVRPDRARVVYVEAADGQLVQRAVQVGRVVDGLVPVVAGLSPSDRVVVEGALLIDAYADQML